MRTRGKEQLANKRSYEQAKAGECVEIRDSSLIRGLQRLYTHSISEALKNDFETWVETPRYFHAIAMASSELIVYEEVEDVEHGSASPVWPAVRQTVSYKL